MSEALPTEFTSGAVTQRLSTGLAKIGMAIKSQAWRSAGSARLTPTQGQAVTLLRARGEMRLDALAAELGVTAPTASDAVGALVRKGLVLRARSAADGRAVALSLTPEGTVLADEVADWPDFLARAIDVLDPDELAEVGKTVRDSLADFNYYMSVSENGKTIPVAKPDAINVDYKDGQLLMFFSVKPSEPMPLKGKLAFGVYDPTFYTSIDFNSDEDMATVGDSMKACKRAVVRPDPDQVLADNQSTLTDAFFSDPTGTNMSKLFATRLELTC